jgi:ribosomal protein L14E/L6E/L27E
MRHSKTSRLYATVPKLRVKAKQSQYEESSPFNNVLDDTENVPFFNFNKPEKDLNLTNEKLIDDDELTEESINDELIDNESVNQNKESTDEKTTDEDDEESTDEESLERTNEVSIYILEIIVS